ncbi:hypothetical protein UFOVP368_63 [uncultured Caudovirales phage]|uniref:Uncharacterized protein n=1 Tax=uncultured Caudovirales phage TaxID=2100421 RepID=A0A6J7X1Y8_9CAUD|nr:hypothetical protein UFOVP368_63 [uncultured Caudovirales phage]
MPSNLTPAELARLAKLDAALADLAAKAEPLKAKRDRLLLLDRQRRFRAKAKG